MIYNASSSKSTQREVESIRGIIDGHRGLLRAGDGCGLGGGLRCGIVGMLELRILVLSSRGDRRSLRVSTVVTS